MKTFEEWCPPAISSWKLDSPIMCIIDFEMEDGTRVYSEVYFVALDRPGDVKKLKSLELSGGWMNEAVEMGKPVLDMLTGRVGRFPPKRWGGPSWSGIILDTNPPDDDHWWYVLAEKEKPKGYQFFQQPPAIIKRGDEYYPNPGAENIRNHATGYDYYLRQIPGKDPEWISVYLMGQYGSVEDGKPVFPEFNDVIHVASEPLKPISGIPLILGMDFGLDPCCVFLQVTPRGQLLILDELVTKGMGVRQFIRDVLKPHIANEYPNNSLRIFGDPAGSQRAQSDERTCFDELASAGLPAEPAAETNAFKARREAVASFLNKMVDGLPGFVMSPKCDYLRKALRGRYKYERLQVPGEARYKQTPCKNHYSHISDALQYGCLAVDSGRTSKKKPRVKRRYTKPADSVAGY
jgi:hypothetical protein